MTDMGLECFRFKALPKFELVYYWEVSFWIDVDVVNIGLYRQNPADLGTSLKLILHWHIAPHQCHM